MSMLLLIIVQLLVKIIIENWKWSPQIVITKLLVPSHLVIYHIIDANIYDLCQWCDISQSFDISFHSLQCHENLNNISLFTGVKNRHQNVNILLKTYIKNNEASNYIKKYWNHFKTYIRSKLGGNCKNWWVLYLLAAQHI